MSTLLLDTNIVSFLFKGDTRADAYASLLQGNRLAIASMTVAELFEWVAVRNWGPQRIARLEHVLGSYLVIPVDVELCRIWGGIRARRQAAGRPIAPQDAWIAATAIQHALPLVTHDPRDFEGIEGLTIHTRTAR